MDNPSVSLQDLIANSEVDFGKQSDDYSKHRPGFPPSFYDRLQNFIPFQGIQALDVGTGPGIVAAELAARGATVTGIDIAKNQIEAARQRDLKNCQFEVATAENTKQDSDKFDLAIAGQSWPWYSLTNYLH